VNHSGLGAADSDLESKLAAESIVVAADAGSPSTAEAVLPVVDVGCLAN